MTLTLDALVTAFDAEIVEGKGNGASLGADPVTPIEKAGGHHSPGALSVPRPRRRPLTTKQLAQRIIALAEDDPSRAALEDDYWTAIAFEHGVEAMRHWKKEHDWVRDHRKGLR